MTSTDVIHSWAVPSLGVKIDAVPGRLNQVRRQPRPAAAMRARLAVRREACGAVRGPRALPVQHEACRRPLQPLPPAPQGTRRHSSAPRACIWQWHPRRADCLAPAPTPAPNAPPLPPTQVWLTIQRPGVFYGQCSELCGANHAFMPIVVEAVTPRQWIQQYLPKWMEA